MRRWIVCCVAAAALGSCGGGGEKPAEQPAAAAPAQQAPTSVFGALESKLLVPRCALAGGCHAGATPAAKLDLSAGNAYRDLVGVKSERRPERLRVAPGNTESSYLIQRLTPGGDTPRMPLAGQPLSPAELEEIRSWIKDGAKP